MRMYSLCVCVCMGLCKALSLPSDDADTRSAAETGVCDICIFNIAYGVSVCEFV